jgi:lysophospholipase L1-like esterase
MIRHLLGALALAALLASAARAQTPPGGQPGDWAWLGKYRDADAAMAPPERGQPRVVFMGDSITELWAARRPFFAEHGYVGRGVSGQTSGQMLLRFHQDVVALRPAVVVILAGTNDVAGNSGPETDDQILANIEAMTEIARAHGIRVVVCSIPPATRFSWRPELAPSQRIGALDLRLQAWAQRERLTYADLWSAMALPDAEMNPELSADTVHPNDAGYALMEPIVQAAVAEALKRRP